jgi:voltage-gated potassium channel
MRQIARQGATLFIIISIVFLIGTSGYMLIEGWSFLDSLYMTSITITTVGFKEVKPLSQTGQIFTILLILTSVGLVAYALGTFSQYLMTPGVINQLRRNRMINKINRLENHFIICGYGTLGSVVAETLLQNGEDVVIIEPDPVVSEAALQKGILVVEGKGTTDEQLKEAGVERARAVISCAPGDADNLFIVFSSRELNPDIFIVSNAKSEDSQIKIMRAGADKVISPTFLGGRHMANLAMRPRVMEFLEFVTLPGDLELALQELTIEPGSELIGKTNAEANIRRRTGATLVAIHRGPENQTISINESTRFEEGDGLIALGNLEQLAELDGITGPG